MSVAIKIDSPLQAMDTASASTSSQDLFDSESVCNLEHSLESGSDRSSEEDSDLEDLYSSFDFEEDASISQASAEAECFSPSASRRGLPADETPLYPGAQVTAFQSRLLVFQFAVRHSLTTKAFTELLQLLRVHVPRGSAVPTSVHSLKRTFVQAFPETEAIHHVYCGCCQRHLLMYAALGLGARMGARPSSKPYPWGLNSRE